MNTNESNSLSYDKNKILKHLTSTTKQHFANLALKIFKTLPSTNDYLKTTAWHSKIVVCLAEEQTKGRGRFSRIWYSPFGQNIYLSIGITMSQAISEYSGISLIVGLAIMQTFKEYGIQEKFYIKWPNDILWNTKKVAGILVEANSNAKIKINYNSAKHGSNSINTYNSNNKLIIGVGINLNMHSTANNFITTPWECLKNIVGQNIDKNKMVALLINNILDFINKFSIAGFAPFIAMWQDYDFLYNKQIKIQNGNVEKSDPDEKPMFEQGIAKGIDLHGHLLLQLENGLLKPFASGEALAS